MLWRGRTALSIADFIGVCGRAAASLTGAIRVACLSGWNGLRADLVVLGRYGSLAAGFGPLAQRGAQRHLSEQPGEAEWNDRHGHPPEKDAVERVGGRLQEDVVDVRRQVLYLLGVEVDPAG